MERGAGIQPVTSSLGSWRSTAELLPLNFARLSLPLLQNNRLATRNQCVSIFCSGTFGGTVVGFVEGPVVVFPPKIGSVSDSGATRDPSGRIPFASTIDHRQS